MCRVCYRAWLKRNPPSTRPPGKKRQRLGPLPTIIVTPPKPGTEKRYCSKCFARYRARADRQEFCSLICLGRAHHFKGGTGRPESG
jgi:hypothetical protein